MYKVVTKHTLFVVLRFHKYILSLPLFETINKKICANAKAFFARNSCISIPHFIPFYELLSQVHKCICSLISSLLQISSFEVYVARFIDLLTVNSVGEAYCSSLEL